MKLTRRNIGNIVVLVAGLMLTSAGCAEQRKTTIAQIEPYAGGRPPTIRPLQAPPKPAPPKPATVATGGESGWVPSKGIAKRWNSIVVHHSASDKSTPEGMRSYHMNDRGWDELGYHFVIGNGVGYGDGKVFVGNRWKQQTTGAHCKTPGNQYNEHGIGICLIGDLQRSQPTPKQMASLAKLVTFLSDRCGISRSRVLTHGGITGKTACPGRHFSLKALFNRMDAQRLSASSH